MYHKIHYDGSMSEQIPQRMLDAWAKFWSQLTRKGDPDRITNPFTIAFRSGYEAAEAKVAELQRTINSLAGGSAQGLLLHGKEQRITELQRKVAEQAATIA